MSTDRVTLANGWSFDHSSEEEIFPQAAVGQCLDMLERWKDIFPKGETWVGRELGVPPLIVRFDCVFSAGKLGVFEIEERPCGVGINVAHNATFKARLDILMQQWPPFKWVTHPLRPTDDELWLGVGLSLDEARDYEGLLLVRSRPEDDSYHMLEPRSVSSVKFEGDKNYGVPLGLWHIAEWQRDNDPENGNGGYVTPPPREACVLKPLQGTRCRAVRVYLGNRLEQRKERGNMVTCYQGQPLIKHKSDTVGLDALERLVRQHGRMVVQPLIMPMRLNAVPDRNSIYRCYFGYSPQEEQYVPLGGVWAASGSLLVHGEEGTIFGPLRL